MTPTPSLRAGLCLLTTFLLASGCDSEERDYGDEGVSAATDAADGTDTTDETTSGPTSDSPDPSGSVTTKPSASPSQAGSEQTAPEDTGSLTTSAPSATPSETEPADSTAAENTSGPGTDNPAAGGSGGEGPAPTDTSEPDNVGGAGGMGPDNGAAGAGGESGVDTGGTVHGRIIDFWNHPLQDVVVGIGEQTAVTNANGEFEIADAPAEYDAAFLVTWSGTSTGHYAYRYEGLTRRDPTLQALTGFSTRQSTVTVTAPDLAFTDDMELFIAYGGPDGATTYSIGETGRETDPWWVGPDTATANYHSLAWTASDGLPTSYLGYDSGVVALADGDRSELQIMPASDVASFSIEGSVSAVDNTERTNGVFVRFPDGARIELVDDADGPNEFAYVAPALAEASILVVASENWSSSPAFAYRTGLTPGGAPNTLVIPNPPTALAPDDGITVMPGSVSFDWAGTDSPVVIHVENVASVDGMYIVTARKNVPLGTFVSGATGISLESSYEWEVQYHGPFADVDAMAGAEGFMDPFTIDASTPMGPRAGSGEFATSALRYFGVVAD